MASENDPAAGMAGQELGLARDQVQFLLARLGQLGNSNIQVRVEGGTGQENQAAEQFVEGCIVLLRRFGGTLIQAADDSEALDSLEYQISHNPGVDLVVPPSVLESTLAADESAPLRVLVAHLAAWQDANPGDGQ